MAPKPHWWENVSGGFSFDFLTVMSILLLIAVIVFIIMVI